MKPSLLCRDIGEASDLLRAMGNANRLAILCLLLEGERSVMEMEVALRIAQPTLSQQLTALRAAGLISARRQAKHVIYRLADARAAALIGTLRGFYAELLPPSAVLSTAGPAMDRQALLEAAARHRLAEMESM